MNSCANGCRVGTHRVLCHYCRKTEDLIRRRLCVACASPVFDGDTTRIEGRCAECRERNVSLSPATRVLLHRAANHRYMARLDSPLPETARKIAA